MKKFLFSALFATMLSMSVFSMSASITPKVACGPYLQNVTSTSFTVMWISDIDAMAWVELAPDDGKSFYYAERPKYFDMSGCGIKPVKRVHRITVNGLEPGTRYRYRIMMKSIADYGSFHDISYGREYGANVYTESAPVVKTLANDYASVRFAVVNDVHEREEDLRKLFSDKKKNAGYDFVVFNGDMTSSITDQEKIVKFNLVPASELFAGVVPFHMVRGNHEYRGKDAIRFLDYHDFPEGKPYYTFKYGKFFFIVLDSGEDKPDSDIEYQEMLCTDPYLRQEAEWLKGVVESDDFKHAERRIVFSHIPPQIEDAWHGNYNMATFFLPVLNGKDIDVMFSGHVHKYSYLKEGTVGADFPVVTNPNCERMEVNLSAGKIEMKIYSPDGQLTHSLTL